MEDFVSEIQKALDRNKKRLDFWREREREKSSPLGPGTGYAWVLCARMKILVSA